MTKEKSDLLKALKKSLADKDKENFIKRNYSITLRSSDSVNNYILASASNDNAKNVEYIIYYNTTSKSNYKINIDPSKTYYCNTWAELQDIAIYLITHPELFNPQLDSLDLLDNPDCCFTVNDVDRYIETLEDYDTSRLYEDYNNTDDLD